ncbi:MAG: hypothetical protein LAO21_23165 [Acidobacteriia bacterium]|nr:hypothetical protein [Terriglobia bacterium]
MHDIRHYINIILESDQYPQVASAFEVENMVKEIHSNQEDFNEGNLLHRISRYTDYVLKRIRISNLQQEWAISDDLVNQYSQMDASTAPPIVYDRLGQSIIDGTHRSVVARLSGDKTILAYVGWHADKTWSEDQLDEEFNKKTDPTIQSATQKDGDINRKAADKMVDPKGWFAKPKYSYKTAKSR